MGGDTDVDGVGMLVDGVMMLGVVGMLAAEAAGVCTGGTGDCLLGFTFVAKAVLLVVLFCRDCCLHFARRFLNHTCNKIVIYTTRI